MSQTPTEPGSTSSGTSQTTNGHQGSGSATVEPWYKDWVQADGTLNHKSLDRLPEHLKPLKETWSRQKTIDDIGTTTVHFQSLAAKKALAPLPADAPENVRTERKAYLDSMNGVPASPKDYGIAKPKDLPDAAWNQKMADGFGSWAHKHSVPPAAVKELMDLNLGTVRENIRAQEDYTNQFFAQEQQKFEATNKRENRPIAQADALVEKGAIALGLDMNNEQTKNFLKGSDARLMAMRHAIAIGEDHAITDNGSGGGEGKDPMALAQDIQRNPANPDYAIYHNREQKFSRSQQEAVIERVNGLLRQAAERQAKGRR